ncbi:MAG: leucine-rich repeat protein [Ruminococcus sp.]|nr:leucine-rich repeat protein [Ruminococcus sp.]
MKIKKLTSIILAAMMTATAVPFNEVTVPYYSFLSYAVDAEANEIVAEGTCGEKLTWTLNNNGNMYIAGEGAMDNWASADDVPWAEYTEQIKRISASDKLKNIGDYAFYGCVNIEMAFFSTIIGEHAYENCKNISGYTYYEDNTPAEIKDYAFYGCDNFSRITIDNSFCVIADSEFVFPDDFKIKCYENSPAHDYAVKYGKEVDLIVYSIASGVCGQNLTWSFDSDNCLRVSGTGKMTNWKSSDEVPWAEYADQIQEIVLQVYDIENIGDYAFSNLKNLTYIPIFGIIGAHAFEGCTNIQGYIGYDNLPVIAVKEDAFKGCNNSLLLFGNPDCYIADTETTIAEGAKIKCFEDSTAHKYALKYGREFELITDKAPVYPENPYVPEESETPDDNNSSENDEQGIAAEGKCGENIKWTLDDNGSLVFSGEGDMDNWASAEDTPWAEYTSMIRTVSMSEEITSIGDYAFYGCENLLTGALTSVIGAHAYEGCKRMNGYSYYGDVSPINEIKDCAFKGCYSLWAIPIANPDCIIADSENVFDNNTAINGYVGSTAHKYAEKYERDFQNITLIDIEGSCGESLYWYMTSDGMLGINGSGKMDNYSEDITAAPWYSYVKDITSICINDFTSDDDAIELSENCFAMCENAETIHFYNSGCIIADSAETIPENAVILGYEGSTAQKYAEKYNRKFNAIPTTDATGTLNEEFTWELNSEGILYITGFGAMADYTDSNPWGEYADKITSVYFYGNVTSIGKNAFSHCKNLEFVDIDESIEFIDMDAFSGCNKLDYLNFHGNKKCVIYDNASTIPAHTELIGHFGSPLHEYADTYERSFYWIDGDINEDSSVDASDASMVLDEYSNIQTGGKAKLSSIETTTADVTNDNVVDAADSSAILQYYAKASTGQNPTWD